MFRVVKYVAGMLKQVVHTVSLSAKADGIRVMRVYSSGECK